MKSSEGNGNHLRPYTRSNTNTRSRTINGVDPADPDGLISIQRDHDELFEDARKIGLPLSEQNMSDLIGLYTDFGMEVVQHGIKESGRLNKISLAYIRKVCENYGKEKPNDDDLPDLNTCVF